MTGELTHDESGPSGLALSGLRVVVTRAAAQAFDLAEGLSQAGALAVEVPVIEICDPADEGAELAEVLGRIGSFDWIVFTSTNAVGRCLRLLGPDPWLGWAKVAAVGVATARELASNGVSVDLVPDRYLADALVQAFPPPVAPGAGSVLLPCAAGAGDVLAKGLADKGWQVKVVEAYRTLRPSLGRGAIALAAGCDVITFASSSAVTGYLELAGRDNVPPVVACIGPVTARTAREAGLEVHIVASEHTTAGLVQALVDWVAAARAARDAGQ